MSVTKEQIRTLALMADLEFIQEVLSIGNEIWTFDESGNRTVSDNDSVKVLTVLNGEKVHITFSLDQNGFQHMDILAPVIERQNFLLTGLSDAVATFIKDGDSNSQEETLPIGVILFDRKAKLIELNKNAEIVRYVNPELPDLDPVK